MSFWDSSRDQQGHWSVPGASTGGAKQKHSDSFNCDNSTDRRAWVWGGDWIGLCQAFFPVSRSSPGTGFSSSFRSSTLSIHLGFFSPKWMMLHTCKYQIFSRGTDAFSCLFTTAFICTQKRTEGLGTFIQYNSYTELNALVQDTKPRATTAPPSPCWISHIPRDWDTGRK